jgi:iron-sulfur-dependent L-serine dehydratase beta subunit
MSSFPSIFNDVIGPVMRGPSSSHCAASLRIARLCRDLMDENIKDILIEFDPNGSLATTHKSQGSDMGLFGGFLGWEAHDERLPESGKHIVTAGINVTIKITDIGNSHPNLYKITLTNNKETRKLTAISTGGGMIEVTGIDDIPVYMAGDYFETLIYCDKPENIITFLKATVAADDIEFHKGENSFIEIKSQTSLDAAIYKELLAMEGVLFIKQLQPVLPVMARENLQVPFITCNEMLAYNKDKSKTLWELAVDYEMARGNISSDDVMEKMRGIVQIMQQAVDTGLRGTHYEDRILRQTSRWRCTKPHSDVCECHYGSKKFHGGNSGSAYSGQLRSVAGGTHWHGTLITITGRRTGESYAFGRVNWCVYCCTRNFCCRSGRLYGRNRFGWWHGGGGHGADAGWQFGTIHCCSIAGLAKLIGYYLRSYWQPGGGSLPGKKCNGCFQCIELRQHGFI